MDALPSERLITAEEKAILWPSIERIPQIYREPLILFYREHQSIENVAESIELTPDAVKQRLSRGRELLHQEVLAFVEGALERTSPGAAFTLGVLAALPVVASSASAATLGVNMLRQLENHRSAGNSKATLFEYRPKRSNPPGLAQCSHNLLVY
jgi:hypothetical protein